MERDPFIGRKRELRELSELLSKNTASLVVIQGRRRIGKSRLVEEFAKGYRFLENNSCDAKENRKSFTPKGVFCKASLGSC